ncbi:MAG: hypothetical protein JSR33_08600, partial [Proteobacteria bacterium]|nr:hypothetical protein [Pseudomonadota bacterium]
MEFESIIQISAYLFVGYLGGFLTSYFKEKGKNQALLSDVKKLTEEKEKVTAAYQLDIAKRKYQYETKKEQFLKYYHLLDEYNGLNNKKFQEHMMPAISKFHKDYIEAGSDQRKKIHASTYFANVTQTLMNEYYSDYTKFKHETSALRLIAGAKVLSILTDIDYHSKISLDKSTAYMKQFSTYVASGNTDKLNEMKIDLQVLGDLLLKKKE